MRFLESFVSCKERVKKILEDNVSSRDSDKILWLNYLVEFHGLKEVLGEDNYLALKNIIMSDKTPTMETLRRIRQKYQESGKYVGKKRLDRLNEAKLMESFIVKEDVDGQQCFSQREEP